MFLFCFFVFVLFKSDEFLRAGMLLQGASYKRYADEISLHVAAGEAIL